MADMPLRRIVQSLVSAAGLTLALGATAAEHAPQQGAGNAGGQQNEAASMSLSKDIVERIQKALNDRGYQAGPVDGVWGKTTQSALRRFQQDQNLDATGKVDAQSLAALEIHTGDMAQSQQQSPQQQSAQQAGAAADQQAAAANVDQRQPAQAGSGPMQAVRLTEFIGKDVRNARGEDLGEISDVVVDVNNERVHYAILSFDKGLALGEKLFAYPMRTLELSPDGDEIVLNVSEERLQRAPGFEEAAEPNWTEDDTYRRDVDRYFGDTVQVEPRTNMLLRRASAIMDADLNAADGNDVGDIEDIVVNGRDGTVEFVVVAFDPGWTEPERLVTLPLQAFRFMGTGNDLTLRVNQAQIATAPNFARDRWEGMNADYSAEVDNWFDGLGNDLDTAENEPINDADRQ